MTTGCGGVEAVPVQEPVVRLDPGPAFTTFAAPVCGETTLPTSPSGPEEAVPPWKGNRLEKNSGEP